MAGIRLFPVIATRCRPAQLHEQVKRLLAQTHGKERIIVVVDGDPSTTVSKNARVSCVYLAERVGVNIARRIGNALVPDDGVICEIDDHDLIRDGVFPQIRDAFAQNATHMVYGDCVWTDPKGAVRDDRRGNRGDYEAWVFQRRCEAAGFLAYRKWLYLAAGEWPVNISPGGDAVLYMRMEAVLNARGIRHLPIVINDVIVDHNGISGNGRKQQVQNIIDSAQAISDGGWRAPAEVLIMSSGRSVAKPIISSTSTPAKSHVQDNRPRPLVLICHSKWGRVRESGGGEISSSYWVPALQKAGFDVQVLATNAVIGDAKKYAQRVDLEHIGERIRQMKPDLVICRDGFQGTDALWKWNPKKQDTYEGIVDTCRELHIPVIVRCQFWRGIIDCWQHGVWDSLHDLQGLDEFRDNKGTSGLWKANGIIANSDFVRDRINWLLRDDRAITEWPVVKSSEVVPKERDPKYILLPSGQNGKGLDAFLSLAAKFPEEAFRVLACHDKEKEKCIEADLPNVEIGPSTTDMRTEYGKTKVVIIGTKTAETFCRAAAEARACGIPLLVTNAGNLPSFVTKEQDGRVIDRDADHTTWETALRECLTLTPKPDVSFCNHEVDILPAMAKDLTVGHDIAVVYPAGAIGVTTGVRHLAGITGVKLFSYDNATEEDFRTFRAVILCGGFLNKYRELAAQLKCPVAFNWRSHSTQMALTPHEMHQFLEFVQTCKGNANISLMASHKPTAELWDATLPIKVRWLPDCVDVGLMPDPWASTPKRSTFTIAVLGPVCGRKNPYVLLEAAKLAGVTVAASDYMLKDPFFRDYAKVLGLNVQYAQLGTEHDVVKLLQQCHAHVSTNLGETFGYVSFYAGMSGLPVIASPLVPICDYLDDDLRTQLHINPCDPKDIAERLTSLELNAQRRQSLGMRVRSDMAAKVARFNEQARKTLLDFVSQERK